MMEAKQENNLNDCKTDKGSLGVYYMSTMWCKVLCVVRFIAHYVLSAKYLTPAHVIQRRQKRMYYTDSSGNIPIKPTLRERFLDLFKTDEKRKTDLLKWVNSRISPNSVLDFSTSWRDGIALCSLLETVKPGLCPGHRHLEHHNMVNNCRLGLRLAQQCLNVPQNMISPEEMAIADSKTELKIFHLISIIKCLSEKKDLEISTPQDVSPQCSIRGSGVNTGVIGKKGRFTVFLSDIFGILDLSVHIKGPQNEMYGEKIINLLQAGDDSNTTEKNAEGTVKKGDVIDYVEDGSGNKFVRQTDDRYIVASAKLNSIVFTCQCSGKGSFLMSYIPVSAGIHTISIRLQSNHVGGSPFKAKIYQPSDLSRKSMKEGIGKRLLFQSLSLGSLEDVAQDMLKESGGVVARIGGKDDSKGSKNSGRQYTIKNKRVLRRIITKNGEEIVVQDTPSPSLSRQTSINTDSDVVDGDDVKGFSSDPTCNKSLSNTKTSFKKNTGDVHSMDSQRREEKCKMNAQNRKELQDDTRALFKLGTSQQREEKQKSLSVEENQRLFKERFLSCKVPISENNELGNGRNEDLSHRKPGSNLSRAFSESVMLLKKKYEMIDKMDQNPDNLDGILEEKTKTAINSEDTEVRDINEISDVVSIKHETSASPCCVSDAAITSTVRPSHESSEEIGNFLATGSDSKLVTDSDPKPETQKLKIITSESMSKFCCYMVNDKATEEANVVKSEGYSLKNDACHPQHQSNIQTSHSPESFIADNKDHNQTTKENRFAMTKRWQSVDVDTEKDLLQIQRIFRIEDTICSRKVLSKENSDIGNDVRVTCNGPEYGYCNVDNDYETSQSKSNSNKGHEYLRESSNDGECGEVFLKQSTSENCLEAKQADKIGTCNISYLTLHSGDLKDIELENNTCYDQDVYGKTDTSSILNIQESDRCDHGYGNIHLEKDVDDMEILQLPVLSNSTEYCPETTRCKSDIGQSQVKPPLIAFRAISSFESALHLPTNIEILSPKPLREKCTQVTASEIIEETGWTKHFSLISIQRRKVNIIVPSSLDIEKADNLQNSSVTNMNTEISDLVTSDNECNTLHSDIQKWVQNSCQHEQGQMLCLGRQSTTDTVDSGIMEEQPKRASSHTSRAPPAKNITYSSSTLGLRQTYRNGNKTFCKKSRDSDSSHDPKFVESISNNSKDPKSFYSELKVLTSQSQDGSDIPQFSPTVYLTTRRYLRFLPREQSFSLSDSEVISPPEKKEFYKTVIKQSVKETSVDLKCKENNNTENEFEAKYLGRHNFYEPSISNALDIDNESNDKSIDQSVTELETPDSKLTKKSQSQSLEESYCGFGLTNSSRCSLLNQLDNFQRITALESNTRRKDVSQEVNDIKSGSDSQRMVTNECCDLRSVFSIKSVDKVSESATTRYVCSVHHEISPTPRNHVSQLYYEPGQIPLTYCIDVTADCSDLKSNENTEESDNVFEADGIGLINGQVGSKNNFQVWAKTSINGFPTVSIIGPRPHCVTEVCVVYTGDNLYEVMYEVTHPGFYVIVVKWSDMEISESPFVCRITY